MALTIRWIMYEKPETHTRLLRHAEAFYVCAVNVLLLSIWMWQDVFIMTSTVSYFLKCTIPFGCFPMLAGSYHIKIKDALHFYSLFSHCSTSSEHTHTRFRNFKPNIRFWVKFLRNWWSNSIHVLLLIHVKCAVLVLLLCSSEFDVHYAFQLPVRLLLSFHFDDCILILISFSDQLSTNNESYFWIRHCNINVPLLLFDAYQFEDEVFQFHFFRTMAGNGILELIGHNQLTQISRWIFHFRTRLKDLQFDCAQHSTIFYISCQTQQTNVLAHTQTSFS